MSWFRVDDSFAAHPKLETLEPDWQTHALAVAAWTLLGADSAARGTNGTISPARVAKVLSCWPAKLREKACSALLSCGLWEAAPDGAFRFHDWSDYQPTKEENDSRRKANAARQAVFRKKRAFEAEVIDRDGWRCVYCQAPVTRSTVTLDHVVPSSKGGTTDAANLVTSCRACNSSKRDNAVSEWSVITPTTNVTRDGSVSNTPPSRPVPSRPSNGGEAPPPSSLDALRHRWARDYETHRGLGGAPPNDTHARSLVALFDAYATKTGRTFAEVLDAVCGAYWREDWPRLPASRASLANLLSQADRLAAASLTLKPAAVPLAEYDPRTPPMSAEQERAQRRWLAEGCPQIQRAS